MKEIKYALVEMYNAHWNEDNAIKPIRITTEAFASGLEVPALTVPRATEAAEGQTGYRWMSNDGPVQQKRGEAQVNLWTTKESIQAIDQTVNVEDWLERARQEIGRITVERVIGLSGYDYIAWGDGEDRHEEDKDPMIYRRMMFVRYSYKKGR